MASENAQKLYHSCAILQQASEASASSAQTQSRAQGPLEPPGGQGAVPGPRESRPCAVFAVNVCCLLRVIFNTRKAAFVCSTYLEVGGESLVCGSGFPSLESKGIDGVQDFITVTKILLCFTFTVTCICGMMTYVTLLATEGCGGTRTAVLGTHPCSFSPPALHTCSS